MFLFARSALFFFGMVLSTVVMAPIVVLTYPLPFKIRYKVSQWWTGFNIWWLKITCRLNCHVTGQENIPDSPVVILAKHQSTWETYYLHQYLPPLAWVVKRELLWVPFFGWAFAMNNPIAIDRKSGRNAIAQVIEKGIACLRSGRSVLLFPEGTRTAPDEKRRYQAGGAKLAVESGFPVLPVAHNAGEYWPRRGFIKLPGTINLVFGPIIESQNRRATELNTQVEQWIEETVAKISQK